MTLTSLGMYKRANVFSMIAIMLLIRVEKNDQYLNICIPGVEIFLSYGSIGRFNVTLSFVSAALR